MKTNDPCPRCGSAVKSAKMGGLCPHCVSAALFGGGQEFDDDLAPIEQMEAQGNSPFAAEAQPDDAVGHIIGRYKVREKIGEGGCGVVYVAEQIEPVRRKVALKLIKLGMDTKAVVARFEAERQALAMMNHPNIARVFDAGAADNGRPYFVMELVRGIKITDYCDQNHLSTTERLGLFVSVCHAVQHAHQRAIIHRDIKPSNILVTLHDGVPVPKVIDFGIAKATEGRLQLTEATVYTQLTQFMGTPAYISPEQAEMSGLDIDTRSDIYSLGVLLYELLTGTTPFSADDLLSMSLEAMRKTIREQEPSRPSTKLSTFQEVDRTMTAKRRSVDTTKLLHQLKGDLDWIVMKCLEKDRTRRYETANGLAADIVRHLNDEPVVARPPSTVYRFQKAFRRNKVTFSAGAAVAATLIVGILLTSWQMVEARKARQLAEAAQKTVKASLYTSLLGQMKTTRIARQVGYREVVFDLIQQALSLETPERNLSDIRREAVASMGDFVGFRPRQIAAGVFSRMQLSPDGRWLELSKDTGDRVIYEVPSGGEVSPSNLEFQRAINAFKSIGERQVANSFVRPAGPWNLVTLSPDGKMLALKGKDAAGKTQPEIEIWDLSTDRLVGGLPDGYGTRGNFSFSTDGRYLFSLEDLGGLVYDTETRKVIDEFTGSVFPSHSGSFLPGRPLLAVPLHQQFQIRIRDCLKRETVAVLQETSKTMQAIFAPQGEFLLTRSEDGVNLYPFARAPERLSLEGHPASVTGIAFSPDGARLVSLSKDKAIRLWSADSGRPIWQGDQLLPSHGQSVAFSPDGKILATGTGESHKVQLWNAETGRQVGKLTGKGNWSWSLQFVSHFDKRLLLVRSGYQGIEGWPIGSSSLALSGEQPTLETISIRPDETVLGVVSSPKGRKIAFVTQAFGESARAMVQDAFGDGTAVELGQVFAVKSSVEPVAFTPDGNSVAFLTRDNRVAVADAATGNLLRSFAVPGKSQDSRNLALSLHGRWLAVSSETRRSVDIYDFAAGTLLYALPEGEGTVYWLAWDPSDEPRLAIARDNGDIAIWDLAQIDQQLANLGLGFPAKGKD